MAVNDIISQGFIAFYLFYAITNDALYEIATLCWQWQIMQIMLVCHVKVTLSLQL